MAEETTTTTTTETPVDYQAEAEALRAEVAKLKASNDRFSSEIAERKRKEREQMSAEAQREAELAEREEHYRELERRLALSDYSAELTDIADDKARQRIVELLADGKIVEALREQKKVRAKERTELEARIRAELMQQNPSATPQGTPSTKTKQEIMAIEDPVERQRLMSQNLHLFI